MKHIIHKHTISLGHALDGLKWSWSTQPNYRVHTILSILAVLGGIFFNVSLVEWCVLVLTISVGLAIETINTAFEATADAITTEWKEEIKIAKDSAAAAMLTYAIGACLIAAIIFIPKML